LNRKETELGSVSNRLESALESTTTNINNLTSSLSTIKDADIAKVSSQYIKHQILQQAAATLLSTANQQPSIALQLI
jgi:flagellin